LGGEFRRHALIRVDRQNPLGRRKIERTVLSYEKVVAHRKKLWKLPLEARKEVVGLPKLRADVILTGVLIFEVLMEEFGFKELRVSTRGLRFAAVMD
jgi:exopolyphosphatase/pppGpp-phosphohydrolase